MSFFPCQQKHSFLPSFLFSYSPQVFKPFFLKGVWIPEEEGELFSIFSNDFKNPFQRIKKNQKQFLFLIHPKSENLFFPLIEKYQKNQIEVPALSLSSFRTLLVSIPSKKSKKEEKDKNSNEKEEQDKNSKTKKEKEKNSNEKEVEKNADFIQQEQENKNEITKEKTDKEQENTKEENNKETNDKEKDKEKIQKEKKETEEISWILQFVKVSLDEKINDVSRIVCRKESAGSIVTTFLFKKKLKEMKEEKKINFSMKIMKDILSFVPFKELIGKTQNHHLDERAGMIVRKIPNFLLKKNQTITENKKSKKHEEKEKQLKKIQTTENKNSKKEEEEKEKKLTKSKYRIIPFFSLLGVL